MSSGSNHSFEGRFWFPGDRHRGYGRLDYDPTTGLRLHLVDSNYATHVEEDARPWIDVLHGETLGGAPVTLFGIWVTNRSWHGQPNGGDVIDAGVNRMIRGRHLHPDEPIMVEHATTTLHGLVDFLTGGQIDRGPLWPRGKNDADVLGIDLPGDVELLLVVSRQRSTKRRAESSEFIAQAQWQFKEPIEFDRAEDEYFSVLRDLVEFSTREVSATTSTTLHFADPRATLKVVQRPYPRLAAEPREQIYALALNLADLEGPEAVVQGWWRLRMKIGPVWNVYFGALHRRESLLDDRLLALLAFCEGYHRVEHSVDPLPKNRARQVLKLVKAALADDAEARELVATSLAHFNGQSQRERLLFFIDRTNEILGAWWYVEREELASRLIHTRNWMVHWGKRGAATVEDTEGMIELVRGLIVITYVNLLLDLGLEANAVAKVIGSGWRLEGPPADVREPWDEDAEADVVP